MGKADGWNLREGNAYAKGNKIYINKERWDLLKVRCQRHIIYHELGHAVLGLDHSRNRYGSIWQYIMYPTIELNGCFK